MSDATKQSDLWTPRSTAQTQRLYADWADTYEADVTAMAYATPDRIARALTSLEVDRTAPILDFGCGTGLSGVALARHGFNTIDGTDISPEMLEQAKGKLHGDTPLFRHLWLSDPDHFGVKTSAYDVIVATGVVSLGAAGPEVLDVLLGALATDGLLAFSYNDPTLDDPSYIAALDSALENGRATQMFRSHGPHFNAKVTGSDVIVLKRR